MNLLKKAVLSTVYPSDCCEIVKREKRKFPFYIPIIFYAIVSIINYTYLFYIHYPLSFREVSNANLIFEFGIIVIPHFSWVIASYLVSSILDGESTFSQQLEMSVYSLTPIIFCTPILGLFSRVLSSGESGIYNFLYIAIILWTVILLFISLMILNDYTFMKAIGITILSLITMIIMWCIILLLLSLTVQLFSFFKNILKEMEFKSII